jgi:hypothetical protein
MFLICKRRCCIWDSPQGRHSPPFLLLDLQRKTEEVKSCPHYYYYSSAFALAWRNYSPRSITPPRFYERFCVRLGANWGYWPSDSTREESITSYSCFSLGLRLLLATGIRHQVQGASVLRLIRRTRAIEVKQLSQGCKQNVSSDVTGVTGTVILGIEVPSQISVHY